MELRNRDSPDLPVALNRLDDGVEHPKGHCHIARVGGDAGVAVANNRMLAGDAADGAAATTWRSFIAGHVGVVEVGAAGSLKQVAARRGGVAQLARRSCDQRMGEYRVVSTDARIRRQIGIAHQRAQAKAAVQSGFDPVEPQAVDVNQVCRRLDFELHQIKKIGASRDELGAWRARDNLSRVARRGSAFIGESSHAALPATSVIASTMLE
jgi:hypothetical protein